MNRIDNKVLKNINTFSQNFWQSFFTLLKNTLQTSTPARIAVSSGAALVIASTIFGFIYTKQPFNTKPVELLGSYVYYTNLNISNRLIGITIFTLVSLLAFLMIAIYFYNLREQEKVGLTLVGFSLLPALIWLFSFNLQNDMIDFYWVGLSAILCLLACLSLLREQRIEKYAGSTVITMTVFFLSIFVVPALIAFLKSPLFSTLVFSSGQQQVHESLVLVGDWLKNLLWLPPILVLLVFLFIPRRTTLVKFVLYPIQILLLLFFCMILPGPFLVGGELTQFFEFTPAFYVIVLPLLVIGIWDCTRRCFFKANSPFSPLPILALLIFVYLQKNPIPGYIYGNDLFEFGIRLPAFWVSYEGWSTLFKNVFIPYGLWDYAQYLFGWIFTGLHTAAVSTYGFHLFQAFILILEFSAVAAFLPLGLAFLICLIAGIGPQSVILIFICILLNPRLIARPAAWIGCWTILCAIIPFARIPQGAICVVASLPAAIWQAVKLFRQKRKLFWTMAGFLSLIGVMISLWPFGKYFWALIRLFREFSKANSSLTGNDWSSGNAPIINVVLGNAMLAMPLIALVAGMILLRRGQRQSKFFITFFLCSFVVLYDFTSISYGFSRLDGLPYYRQLFTFMSMLLPLLAALMVYIPSRVVRAGCIGVLLCFLTVWPTAITNPRNYIQTQSDLPELAKSEIQDASTFGLPQLGVGNFPTGHLETEQIIKQALDRVLAPDETFLNLTMEGLHYFSSQRKVVTEHIVYYDFPGDQSQLRAIEELRNQNVKVTLLEPTYVDLSPSSLRTYYLYRYALLHGLPFEISPKLTLLLPPEYFTRMGETPPDAVQTLRLLDKQFPLTDFSSLPGVWGRGYQEFVPNLHVVRELTTELGQVGDGRASNEIVLQPPLRGVDAGLLGLDIDMPAYFDSIIRLQWVDETLPTEVNQIQFKAYNGTNIVPLDASPRWLLARSLTSLTINIASFQTSQMELKNIWQVENSSPSLPLMQGKASCSFITDRECLAQSNNPRIFYSIPDELIGQSILVHIVFEAPPGANSAQIFYRTASTEYNESDKQQVALTEGKNEIYFTIPDEMSKEQLRFDPGIISGNYVISTVEAKPILTSSIIKITRAALYQRPYIDDR
jgi:hypothetical protein